MAVYSYIISFLCVSASSICCLVFRDPLLSLFVPGQPDAIAYGAICNVYIVGFAFILGLIVINNQLVQAFGFTTYQMAMSLVFLCGFRVLWLAFVYSGNQTFDCLMLTYPISWMLNFASVIPLVLWCLVKYSRGKDFKL